MRESLTSLLTRVRPMPSMLMALALCASLMASGSTAQADLTPPGPPSSTMKRLDQVEPRTPITSLPVTITEPGSYYVTGNLSDTTGGITIDADDVTLDLMGFTLTGNGQGFGIDVTGDPQPLRNVVVRNGSIRNFLHGVRVTNAEYCRFEELTLAENADQGFDLNIPGKTHIIGNTFQDCSVIGNGAHGLYANALTELSTFSDNSIIGCLFRDNGSGGVSLYTDGGMLDDNLIEDCIVKGNEIAGISLVSVGASAEASGTIIQGCIISDTSNGGGIRVSSSVGATISGSRIVDNHVRNTFLSGIQLSSAENTLVEGNQVTDTRGGGSRGIRSSSPLGSSGNLFIRNMSANNDQNYALNVADTHGPIVTVTGALASSGDSAHPWANFSF